MSTVSKRVKKDRNGNPTGHVWRAQYVDDRGKPIAKHFARKTDAARWLDEVTTSIVTGQYVDPNAGRVTFKQFAEEWRARQTHRPSSAAHVETMLRRHAYPAFGDVALAQLRPSMIQTWVRKMSETLAPATIRVAHGIVAGICNDAVRDRRMASNPCADTRLPKSPKRRIHLLTTEQVAGIHAAMAGEYQALVHMAVATGMRQGEAFAVTVDRVDFLRRTITVDRQIIARRGTAPGFGPPKTMTSDRVIPVPEDLTDALSAHIAAYGTGRDGLIFTAADGGPVRKSTFNGRKATRTRAATGPWITAVTAAGVPAATFHQLRHYYASLLIRHGESVKTVQARLGHATAAETLDTYSHLWPDSDDRTRLAVAGALTRTDPDLDYGSTT